MMPACSSGTLTNVLPHRNVDTDTGHDTPPHHSWANLSLCYPLMWNVTQEYTTTHFNVFGKTRSENPSLTTHTANAQLYDAVVVVVSQKLDRKCTMSSGSLTRDLRCVYP